MYRVLTHAGLLNKWNRKGSKKGTGFVQPLAAHEHWHIDISYINIRGTFYYLCSILDGFSRSIVHWEIREAMKESDVEIILQRAHEKYPDARAEIIPAQRQAKLAAARESRKDSEKSLVMKRRLTGMMESLKILLAGQTEADSADAQPARDSRLKATNSRWGGSDTPVAPHFESGPFGVLQCL